MPGVIDAYLSEFDRHLAFDPRLARRVREEIGSHLAEAIDDEAREAEAVARFGDPKILSKAFVEAALPRRLKNTGLWLIILAVATFVLMRLRSFWFDLAAERSGWFALLTNVDRLGFVLGLGLAGYAWRIIHGKSPNAERAILCIHLALLAFAVSINASLMRAYLVTGPDNILWLTGCLEISGLAYICWQLRIMFRHTAMLRISG